MMRGWAELQAADQGNAEAMNALGFMYYNGDPMPQVREKQVHNIRLPTRSSPTENCSARCDFGHRGPCQPTRVLREGRLLFRRRVC
jgi:hypothetical protein